MPETYGLPESEPSRREAVGRAFNEVIAGQHIVRRIVLYVLLGALLVSPAPGLAIIPLVLLMATDEGLA